MRKLAVIVAVLMMAGAVLYPVLELWPYWRAQRWPQVACTIRESRVELQYFGRRRGSGRDYILVVRYTYEYAGTQYAGRSYNPDRRDWHKEEAEEMAKWLSPGTQTQCYVNPDEPSEAVVNRTYPGDASPWLTSPIFLLLGAYMLSKVRSDAQHS